MKKDKEVSMQTKEKIKLSLWNIPLDYRLKSIQPNKKVKVHKKELELKETEKEVD